MVQPPVTPGTGQGPKPPSSLLSSTSFILDCQHVAEMAAALGHADDAAYWAGYAAALIVEYNAAFLNANGYVYGNANGDGLQTANAVSVAAGATGWSGANFTATVGALANDISVKFGGAWMTGIIGMKALHTVLTAGAWRARARA